MNCQTPLFSEVHAEGLTPKIAPIIKKNRDKSPQEVYKLIVGMLNNQESFLFGGENSGARYNASIVFLRKAILDLVEPITTRFMGTDSYTQLKRLFEDNFLADAGIASGSVKNDTEPETPYMENNPDMINEDERVKQKLDSIVETYYGTVIKANNFRKQQFGVDLVKAAIIDTDQKIIVRSNADLNKALCLLKNRYLGNIVAYLRSIDPNFSAESRVFGDNFKKIPGYEQTLNRFYNELKTKKKEGSVEDLITEGWKKRLSGQNDLFYDALNSYVNLVYFDDILEDAIGRVIQLSNSGYAGVELDAQYGKYKFSKGDEHKRKGYHNSENRNALNDIAKFSRLVLSTIPIYSAIDGKFLNRYVTVGNFANAITSLFTHAHLLGNNYLALQEAVTKFHSNPYYYSEIIFKELSDSKTNIQRALINAGVNRFNINVLTSVFKYVFDTNNPSSIKSIETASLKKQFSIDGYSIIDSINGVIDRTMDATYLQMVYSGNTDMVEVSPKKKYTDRKVSYNIVNRINATNSSRPQEVRKKLSTRFPITKADLTTQEKTYDSSCMTFSVSLGQNAITGITRSKMGILDSKPIDIKFSNPRMVQIFDQNNTTIDLISKQSVERLVSGSNLSADEQMFRDTLEFIDAFLGTKLLSVDGLNKLYFYKITNTTSDNYLSEFLESAIRAAVVNDLYYKFNNDLEDGKYQSVLNFEGFLKAEYTPFGNLDFKNVDETKNFFLNKLGIPELISVRTSENWIDQIAEVEATITGEVSKSVISDINDNKIANNRTSFLGGNLQYYLSKYKAAGQETATNPLLFTRDSSLVVKTVFNTDAQSRLGIKKSVKDMKAAELFYSSIIYNFYGSYLQSDFNSDKFGREKNELYRTLLTQPTTFSDKISFVMYAINANKAIKAEGKSYDGKTIWELNTEETLDLYQDTIGAAYINLFNNVLDDLRSVLGMPDATAEQINQVLNNTVMMDVVENGVVREEGLLTKAQRMGKELQLDTHYRAVKGTKVINGKKYKVTYGKFNELLYHYATDLYVNRNSLKKRFEIEKVNFINDLLTSGVSFYTNYYDDSDDVLKGKKGHHTSNPVSKIINQLYKEGEERENYKKNWVKNNKLVLARVNGQPIINGAEISTKPDDVVELNPLLEKYFFTDSLLANNLRFELTGSEVAHPDKAKINYSEEVKKIGITPETNPSYFQYDDEGNVVVQKGVPQVINSFSDLVWLKNQSIQHPALKQIFDAAILKTEAVAQGTQLKRNVIIPATLQYEQQNTLNGIPARMKVAVISDTQASVFNFRGDNITEDAHDGSAYINPFVSILENKALQDQEVGVDKKPIWHSYNPRLMSATLLKFATFTMTNERMRTSLNSNISLYNLFKQMTNRQWYTTNPDGTVTWNNSRNAEFNLVDTKGFRKNQFDKINFFTDILAKKPLFYEENGNHYQVIDFGRDEHGYYTLEAAVNSLGSRIDSQHDIKVYHVFDKDSNHLKFRDSIPVGEGLHTINSLFELFNAMGGIYSEELVEDEEGNKDLQYTDASSYAVVNFMNNISIRVGNNTEDLSQYTYYQPLKEMMIAYVANKSAVKNGISNINGSEAWLGNTDLKYMELDTDGLGIQMDADHEIDESEMTEFSQVISALEAGGRLHHISKQVYRTLGELAVQASQIEIDTAIKYINAKNAELPTDKIRSELYDILGRALINNYKPDENRTDLAAPIIAEIKKKFNLSEDHSLDDFKIPFSDSNLYKQTISTFVSNINSKSIKRKYPGSGCVMVPGYDIIQTYKYNGKIKQFDDVLKEARTANFREPFFREFNPQIESISSYNKYLVQAYLGEIQKKEWKNASTDVGRFIPTDIVDILIDGEYLTSINLDDIGNYYAFKGFTKEDPDGINAEANRRGFIGRISKVDISKVKDITFAINVTKPRNLAPARIQWQYEAPKEENDAILGRATDNEFGSDVAVILKNPQENVYFLGTSKDFENFKVWKQLNPNPSTINDSDPILNQVRLVLKRNPEFFNKIRSIGATIEDYASYVRNIFPNSKEKDIYWHGSNSDFSEGFDSAVRGVGSGAPEVENEFYLAKQPYSVLQYVNGVNRNFPADKNGFSHWNKLYWELKEIMSNGRRENNKWKNLVIGPEGVRQNIPNKKGIFNRDSGGNNGKYLSERKADYGYENKSDEEFFRDVFGIEYGKDTFNTWIAKNRAIFKTLEDTQSGIYPAVINVTSPIIERGKNTYYEEERGLKTLAKSKTHLVTTNIFDTAPVRYSFLGKGDPKENRKQVQKLFDELDKGLYLGKKIYNLKNEAAELVISNMYASKFNTKGKALADILERGPNFFKISKVKAIHSRHYEMAFTTNNGRHTYISFKTPKVDDNSAFQPKDVGWKYTKTITKQGQENVYATTKDGQILFKVGTNILRSGVDYVAGQFIDKETGEQIINNNLRINSRGQVVEYKEFISRFKVTEPGRNGKPITYDLYSINSKNIGDAQHNSTTNSVNGQIASILSKVYNASNYNGIRLNYDMPGSSALRISEVLPKLKVDGSLKDFVNLTLNKYLVNIDPEKTFSINQSDYDKDLKNFYNQSAGEIYASFEKSLTFTSSRIPAQTLQSFMQMKAVALTQSSKNIAYVSHWQTW